MSYTPPCISSHLVSSQLITSLEMEGALLKGRSDRSVYFLEKVCVCVSVLRVRRVCFLKIQCVFVCVYAENSSIMFENLLPAVRAVRDILSINTHS
jgi:hypothetical protein